MSHAGYNKFKTYLNRTGKFSPIVRKIKNEELVRNKYGITGYSPLLDLPGFNIVHDVPLDEFHLIKEGLVKMAVTRLFRANRAANEVKKKFNRRYLKMRTFKDSPRRTRSLNNLPDFKGATNMCTSPSLTVDKYLILFPDQHAGTEYGILVFSAFPYLFKEGMSEAPVSW